MSAFSSPIYRPSAQPAALPRPTYRRPDASIVATAIDRADTGLTAVNSYLSGVQQGYKAVGAPSAPIAALRYSEYGAELNRTATKVGAIGSLADALKIATAEDRYRATAEVIGGTVGERVFGGLGAAACTPLTPVGMAGCAAVGSFVGDQLLEPVAGGIYDGFQVYNEVYDARTAGLGAHATLQDRSLDSIRVGADLAFGGGGRGFKDAVTDFAQGFTYTYIADATNLGSAAISGAQDLASAASDFGSSVYDAIPTRAAIGGAAFDGYESIVTAVGGYLGPDGSAGCGDAATGSFVPDGLFGTDFRAACDAHDARWASTNLNDRTIANVELGLGIIDAAAGKPWYQQAGAAVSGFGYTMATDASAFAKAGYDAIGSWFSDGDEAL